MIIFGQSNAIKISGRWEAIIPFDRGENFHILFSFQEEDARISAKFYNAFGIWRFKKEPTP